MNNQSTNDNSEAIGAEVAPPGATGDPRGNTGRGLEAQSDQSMNPDPSLGENLQTEEAEQHAACEEGTGSLRRLSFPRKLWAVVENEAFKSLRWTEEGDAVKLEVELFETEILRRRGADKIFEKDSLKTMIYELNLHGFRKIRTVNPGVHSGEKKTMIYQNANFQRDKPRLLENIRKKGDRRSPPQDDPCCKRSKLDPAISRKEAANDQGPRSHNTCIPTGVSGCPQAVCPPQEHCVPCAEFHPDNDTMVSLASDKIEGCGKGSSRLLRYPDFYSMALLYRKGYSMMCALMSALCLREGSAGKKKQEGSTPESSDDKEQECSPENPCITCQLYKRSSQS